jgi:hypothetical protein
MNQPAGTPVPIPKWTQYVVTDLGGRDPLGLSRVSFMITDYLVTGIITTTSRARYYSFYTWALWHIDNFERPKRYADFTAAFRRRESFLALCTLLHNPESAGVVGADAVRSRLTKYMESKEVDTNFAVLPSNTLGGFGQYYGGSLYALSLTHRDANGIDHTEAGRGVALAEAFNHSVDQTNYLRQGHFTETEIPFHVLKKSASQFSLDSLSEVPANQERALLRNLFFSWDHSDISNTDLLRRHTLGLILDTVSEYGKVGFKPSSDNVDHHLVYPPYYYGAIWRDCDSAQPYRPPTLFAGCHGFWQQFCAHEFLTQALEKLLNSTLETLNLQPSGMTLTEVCSSLTGKNFRATLNYLFGADTSPSALMESLGIDGIPSGPECDSNRKKIGLTSIKSELTLSSRKGTPEEIAAGAIGILAILYAKWRSVRNEFVTYVGTKTGSNLWTGLVLPMLDQWIQPTLSWEAALKFLLDPFVLDQHDRIMYEKGRLESCWLHRLDGKIQKDQDYQPAFRSSRHWNCVRILRDVGLLDFGADHGMSITSDGRKVLARIVNDNDTRK